MPDADLLGPDGSVVATLSVPEGASPDLIQQMGQRAMLAVQARQAAVDAGHPDPDMFVRQIGAESNFQPEAVSPKGAKGPAQFMPGTAAQYHVVPGGDPTDDLRGGAEYSRDLIQQFGGDTQKGAAAYNAGPGNVQKYGGVPPFAETLGYVQKVAPSPTSSPTPSPAPAPLPLSERMPMVTTELAGEGVPPPRPTLLDRLPDETARFAPGNFEKMGEMMLGLTLPAARTYKGAAALGAGFAGFTSALEKVRDGGWHMLSSDEWQGLGQDMLLGAGLGTVMHGVSNLIFGRPAAMAPDEGNALTRNLIVPGSPTAQPERDAALAVLTKDGTAPPIPYNAESLTAYRQHVDDILYGALPQASREAEATAYQGFKQAVGDRAVDVTKYNRVLRDYADTKFPQARLSAGDRLLAPIGHETPYVGTPAFAPGSNEEALARYRGWSPPKGQVASVDEILASEAGISHATGLKAADGKPAYPGSLIKSLFGSLKTSLRDSLTPDEWAAYEAARDAATKINQRERAIRLLTAKTADTGVGTDVVRLAKQLERQPTKYAKVLGPETFRELSTIANAGRTLSKQPEGRVLFAQLLPAILGAAAGGTAGALNGGNYAQSAAAGGALTGAFLGSRLHALTGPQTLHALEWLSRQRGTGTVLTEGLGRLGVALALDQESDARQATPPPFPIPTPTPSPLPLGRVGAP